jgi:predicted MPP superfamily phosphohydrolase
MTTAQALKFLLVFTVMSLLLCGLVYFMLRRRLGLSQRQNRLMLAGLMTTAVLMIAGPVAYRQGQANIDGFGQQLFQFLQYFLMGWVAIVLLTFFALEVLNSLVRILQIPFQPEKRTFLTEGVSRGFVAGTGVLAVGGLFQAAARPKVERVEITLPNLPHAFEGFSMAQISDVHIGPLLHREFLEGVVDEVLALKADVILITGDLVDGTVEQLRQQIEPLRRLKARDGIYFCTGNHEYYSGAEEWIAYLESMGIHVFRNSNIVLRRDPDKILLGGVYDWQAGRYFESHAHDAKKAAQTDEPVDCKILIAHNPFSIEDAREAGWNLQLSGHTHAGQFYPFAFIVKAALKHSEGLYRIDDRTQLYVNRGTGYWGPPNRLGISSEITHHILKCGRA